MVWLCSGLVSSLSSTECRTDLIMLKSMTMATVLGEQHVRLRRRFNPWISLTIDWLLEICYDLLFLLDLSCKRFAMSKGSISGHGIRNQEAVRLPLWTSCCSHLRLRNRGTCGMGQLNR